MDADTEMAYDVAHDLGFDATFPECTSCNLLKMKDRTCLLRRVAWRTAGLPGLPCNGLAGHPDCATCAITCGIATPRTEARWHKAARLLMVTVGFRPVTHRGPEWQVLRGDS